jgi:hypothetical protein
VWQRGGDGGVKREEEGRLPEFHRISEPPWVPYVGLCMGNKKFDQGKYCSLVAGMPHCTCISYFICLVV